MEKVKARGKLVTSENKEHIDFRDEVKEYHAEAYKSTFRLSAKSQVKFEKMTFIEKTKKILTPFARQNSHRQVVDAIYFPQRLMAPVVISLVSVSLLAAAALAAAGSVKARVTGLSQMVNKTVNKYLAIGTAEYFLQMDHDITDDQVSSFTSILSSFERYLTSFSAAFASGVYIGIILGTFLVLKNILGVLFDFRTRVKVARKGDQFVKNFGFASALTFGGYYISFVMISFVIIIGLCSLLFTFLLWDLVWDLIASHIYVILLLVAAPIAQSLTEKVMKVYSMSKNTIKHRNFLSYLELFLFYEGIIAGIMNGIVRFIIGIAVLILGMTRIDQPAFPEWVLKIFWFDLFNSAYYATIHVYTIYNNPIYFTFTQLLIKCGEEAKAKAEAEDAIEKSNDEEEKALVTPSKDSVVEYGINKSAKWRKVRNQWHMARLLLMHPELAEFRGHYIDAKREAEAEESKK